MKAKKPKQYPHMTSVLITPEQRDFLKRYRGIAAVFREVVDSLIAEEAHKKGVTDATTK